MTTKHGVVSVGYSGLKMAQLTKLVADHGATLVDVRLKPFSRSPQWNQGNLHRVFGASYLHVPELGNKNYKGGPIALVDEARGLARLREVLTRGPIAVLCVCADPAICHRTVVTTALAAEGYPILTPALTLTP